MNDEHGPWTYQQPSDQEARDGGCSSNFVGLTPHRVELRLGFGAAPPPSSNFTPKTSRYIFFPKLIPPVVMVFLLVTLIQQFPFLFFPILVLNLFPRFNFGPVFLDL